MIYSLPRAYLSAAAVLPRTGLPATSAACVRTVVQPFHSTVSSPSHFPSHFPRHFPGHRSAACTGQVTTRFASTAKMEVKPGATRIGASDELVPPSRTAYGCRICVRDFVTARHAACTS